MLQKSRNVCIKAVDNYRHVLEFVPECCKTQKMCDKAVVTYPSTIKFVPECFVSQEMCDKVVNICFLVFDSISDWYKTQQMCDRIVSEDPFLIVYYPDKYEICFGSPEKKFSIHFIKQNKFLFGFTF